MPLAFSFFPFKSSPTPDQRVAAVEAAAPEEPQHEQPRDPQDGALPELKSPFSDLGPAPLPSPFLGFPSHSASPESDETLLLASHVVSQQPALVTLPERRKPHGLAAMAVNQSGLEAPPLNRRATLQPFPLTQPTAELPAAIETAPMTQSWHAASERLNADESSLHLRTELMSEIEQVKSDLFGAAMGVSALKDRLDGLELLVSPSLSPAKVESAPSHEEMKEWMARWLADHLPGALDRALETHQQKLIGAMSTPSYFRSPVSPSIDRLTLLSQPPVILATTTL